MQDAKFHGVFNSILFHQPFCYWMKRKLIGYEPIPKLWLLLMSALENACWLFIFDWWSVFDEMRNMGIWIHPFRNMGVSPHFVQQWRAPLYRLVISFECFALLKSYSNIFYCLIHCGTTRNGQHTTCTLIMLRFWWIETWEFEFTPFETWESQFCATTTSTSLHMYNIIWMFRFVEVVF